MTWATSSAEKPARAARAGRSSALGVSWDAQGRGRVPAPAPDPPTPRAQRSRTTDPCDRSAHRGGADDRPRAMLQPSTCPLTDRSGTAGILGVAGVPPRVHLREKALRCYNCGSRGRSEPSNGQRATRADPDKASSVGPGALETGAEPARYAVLPAVQTRRAMVRRSQTCLASAPGALLSRGAYQELGRRLGGKPKRTPFGAR